MPSLISLRALVLSIKARTRNIRKDRLARKAENERVRSILKQGLARKAASIALLPIEFVLSLPFYLACVRALRITAPGRIGHLAVEPDIFLKLKLLGLRRWNRGVIIIPPGSAANDCLLDYWSRHIKVIRYPFWSKVLARLTRFRYLQYDVSHYTVAINNTAPYIAVYKAWGDRPSLLALTDKHRREGRARLADLGVPAGAEIICFHCRDGGYSPADEEWHSFRNCSVENYLPAVGELASQGHWCIRMGDPSTCRIQPMERIIDYAHLDVRSDWMDVFLCASCRFFLGSASGLVQVAGVFGTPSAVANQVPLSSVLEFCRDDVAIPKLLWSESEERYLTFHEVFSCDAANFRFTALYQEHRVQPVENTAEDIRNLALEMVERVEGRAIYTREDEELQRQFKALMRPGHYSYGGISRVGRDFLRKYQHLLGDGER